MTHTENITAEIISKHATYTSAKRRDRMNALGLGFAVEKSQGARIFDTDGKSYIDCFCSGGQFVLGHRHPEMVAALRSAMAELDLGNFPMISAQKASLAKSIAEITPGELKCSVFAVNRGETNEFALKLSRGYTGRKEIICFEGGRHGETGFALSVSDDDEKAKLFGPLIPHVKRIPLNADAIVRNVSDRTAAVIVEPIQSDAGVIMPPAKLLSEARKACDRSGAVLVFDEGQLAFGRAGRMFACELSGVTPDVLCFAKGLGGTIYPIAATVFTSKLNRFMLTHPLIHLSTFGGADAGCVVAMAFIEHLKKNKLWENAEELGGKLADGLKAIAAANPGKLKEVRSVGMLAAVDTLDTATAEAFTRSLAGNGVIALPAPGRPACVRFTPPIDITAADVDSILESATAAAKSI